MEEQEKEPKKRKPESKKGDYAVLMSPLLRKLLYPGGGEKLTPEGKETLYEHMGADLGEFIEEVLVEAGQLPERPRRGTVVTKEKFNFFYEKFMRVWLSWKAGEKLVWNFLQLQEQVTGEPSLTCNEELRETRKDPRFRSLDAWKHWLHRRDSSGRLKPDKRAQSQKTQPRQPGSEAAQPQASGGEPEGAPLLMH